ncbi:hypothetical protein HYW55_06070 [Candidatus Gottesmanbacteria bacterium]|nr:hypothetical protein [Candidatus Gottesmanbacteria bacterium]
MSDETFSDKLSSSQGTSPPVQSQTPLPVQSSSLENDVPTAPTTSTPPPTPPPTVVVSSGNGPPVWFLLLFLLTVIAFLTMTVMLYQRMYHGKSLLPESIFATPTLTATPLPSEPPVSQQWEFPEIGESDELATIEADINGTNLKSMDDSMERLDREVRR